MRYSVYTSPRDLFFVSVVATRSLATKMNPWRRRLGDDYPRLAAAVESALAAGPLAGAQIRKIVDPDKELGDLFSILLGLLGAECRIVRAANLGGWRSNRLSYALWSDWVGATTLPDEDEARLELGRRYAAAYGPVTESDLRWWTGWAAAESKTVAAEIDLEQTGDAHELLEGVRLLPVWDVLMVAYRDRSRLIEESLVPFAYDRSGNATSVVYDRGRVVGVWDLGKSDDPLNIKVAPFGNWPRRRWKEVDGQAARIAAMIGAASYDVSDVGGPPSLFEGKRNQFLAPLADA